MKTKNLLPFLFILFAAINSNAQTRTKLSIEPTIKNDLILQEFNDPAPLKSAAEGELVLDSMKRTEYLTVRDTSQVYTTTYKYDSEGRRIELVQKASCMFCPGRIDDTKTIYQYDEQGNYKTVANYIFDQNVEEWILVTLKEYEIDSKGNTTLIIEKQPDIDSDEIINYRKIEYHNNDNIIYPSQTISMWNKDLNQWIYSSKSIYEFNENGQVEYFGDYNYDLEMEEWIKEYEYERYYDSNGYDSLIVVFFKVSADEIIYQKQEMKVDEFGNIIEALISDKDTAGNWEAWLKEIFEYDQNGNNTYTENIIWQPSYDMWISSSKTETEYDSELNKEMFVLNSSWDISTNSWVPYSRAEFEYNSIGNRIYYSSASWNQSKNVWENERKYISEYDEYDNQVFYGSYEWRNNAWWLSIKYEYFYSELTTGLNDYLLNNSDVKIYPNPANEILTIEIKNVGMNNARIYNAVGESVRNIVLQQGRNSVNLSDLNKGLYFIQIPTDKGLVVSKVIKN